MDTRMDIACVLRRSLSRTAWVALLLRRCVGFRVSSSSQMWVCALLCALLLSLQGALADNLQVCAKASPSSSARRPRRTHLVRSRRTNVQLIVRRAGHMWERDQATTCDVKVQVAFA
jgi:hypothetical protein